MRYTNRHFTYLLTYLLGARGGTKFNQLEMVTTFSYKSNLVKIDARNFELIVVTDHKHTNKHTSRQGRLQYTAPQLSAQCNQNKWECTK